MPINYQRSTINFLLRETPSNYFCKLFCPRVSATVCECRILSDTFLSPQKLEPNFRNHGVYEFRGRRSVVAVRRPSKMKEEADEYKRAKPGWAGALPQQSRGR